jgi:hypothetical protein
VCLEAIFKQKLPEKRRRLSTTPNGVTSQNGGNFDRRQNLKLKQIKNKFHECENNVLGKNICVHLVS